MSAPIVAKAVAKPKPTTTKMQIDGYLPCESYAGHSDSPAENFRIFQNTENGEHYFTMVSKMNKVVFRSEGYPTTASRNNGLASVQKNSEIRGRYTILEEEGKHFVILKAGNHQEIARSCPYNTLEELYALFPFMVAGSTAVPSFDDTPVITEAITTTENNIDQYLPCEAYAGHSDSPVEGISTFEKDGMYYFSMLDKDGNVSMRSESYPTISARDNGVTSVLKNRDNKDRYAEIEEDNVHYIILKAGNHQEIARSCPSNSKIGLLAFLPLLGLAGLGFGATAATATSLIGTPAVEVPTMTTTTDNELIGATAASLIGTPAVEVPTMTTTTDDESKSEIVAGGLPKWLLPLLGILLLAGLLWWLLRGCNKVVPVANVETPVVIDTVKTATTTLPANEPMEDFAPVILYFDNDEPNKNSKSLTTSQTYTQAFNRYQDRKSTFESESDTPESKAAIAAFFEQDVKKGYNDLNILAAKIAKNITEGEKVNITVKGFASPLAKNDYNTNLTKRRINSIKNFFSSYDGGKLNKLMDKISITEQANGEDSSASGLSDDEKNIKLSIYDLAPSKERRVEIVDVRFVKE